MKKENFKVLTLDGGGVRGYLSVTILEKLEKALQKYFNDKKTIGERFDLIVGTSTGGIIAAGLSIGKSASEIKQLYEKLLKKIFQPHTKGIIKPKYNQKILREELYNILKEKTFKDVKIDLCLTSVDISTSKPRFFKSPYMEKFESRADEKIIDAVLATSAAPIYFPIVDTKYSFHLADGGLVANNPTMIGITDAYQITNDFNKIKVLSIGTGEMKTMPYDIKKIKKYGGMNSWALNSSFVVDAILMKKKVIPILEILLNAQSSLITAQANILLKNNFYRINPSLPTEMDLDELDEEKINTLKNLALQADSEKVKKRIINLIKD